MDYISLLTGSLIAVSAPPSGDKTVTLGGESIRLPVARPQIEFVGEVNSVPSIEPQNEIFMFDPKRSIFSEKQIPSSIDDAVAAMQIALPRDYRLALLAQYGWSPQGQVAASARTDLRSNDLSQFLYDKWAYSHPKSRLAKEFRCLVSWEGDISAFELLIVERTRQDLRDEENLEPISRSAAATYRAAAMSAWVASRACERLVKKGWFP